MKAFLDLVRWKNLVIVILTMTLMRYAIIAPLLDKINVVLASGIGLEEPMKLQMPWYDFAILVLATVLITAGGYVINDYFDIKTDLINRGEVLVGTKIPRRKAILWHSILNVAGITAGFYVSWKAGYLWLGTLFLLVSGLLYFYSASYKRQFLIGNLIVAILTAMVPMLVVIYEWPAIYKYYQLHAEVTPKFDLIIYWVGGFALFAFLTTLTREIIKDIEDFEGDMAYGRNTVPVIIGVNSARIVAISLVLITALLLYLVWYFFINDWITFIYLTIFVVFPLIFVIYKLTRDTDKRQMHGASNLMKIVMLTGILYSVIVKIILSLNLFNQ
ncbi:MAG: geranylgeranylglycerol-phosphate geranylgeranyltransferase [Bacteroidales bacterium]|nr:geranylgeranylglycerol-phosphate geranylgeranyltransferase [Bacteroidales bacterium]